MPAKKSANSLDEQFKQLEKNIQQLENDALPIEEALKSYEQSMQMIKQCQAALASIEQKVSLYQSGEMKSLDDDS